MHAFLAVFVLWMVRMVDSCFDLSQARLQPQPLCHSSQVQSPVLVALQSFVLFVLGCRRLR